MRNSSPTQCEGKVAFPERRLAEEAAGRRANRRAYKCEVCRQYHVGGRDAKKFKRPSPVRLG